MGKLARGIEMTKRDIETFKTLGAPMLMLYGAVGVVDCIVGAIDILRPVDPKNPGKSVEFAKKGK